MVDHCSDCPRRDFAVIPDETAEILNARLSYYQDLLVRDGRRFHLDTAEGAAPTTKLLAYANSQLLEFRHYDDVLTVLLSQVYDAVSAARLFGRWRLAGSRALKHHPARCARAYGAVDNSIKFLSDSCGAPYRLAPTELECRITAPWSIRNWTRRGTLRTHDGSLPARPRVSAGADGGSHLNQLSWSSYSEESRRQNYRSSTD